MDPEFELEDPEMESYLQSLAETDATATVSEAAHMIVSPETTVYTMTGRPPYTLYLSCDGRHSDDAPLLSEHQQLLRKQIQVFEAGPDQVAAMSQGRNKPIVLGQVGIRCRHCAGIPPTQRARGAVYFPSKLEGVYQMAQNMAQTHLCGTCTEIPKDLQAELIRLREMKTTASGTGKSTWADRVKVLGVYEDQCGLRYTSSILQNAPQG